MRQLVTIGLPLVLPILVYAIYLALARRKARLEAEGRLPGWQEAPWGWMLLAGLVLTAASLGYWRETSGVERTAPFLPPLSGKAPEDRAPADKAPVESPGTSD